MPNLATTLGEQSTPPPLWCPKGCTHELPRVRNSVCLKSQDIAGGCLEPQHHHPVSPSTGLGVMNPPPFPSLPSPAVSKSCYSTSQISTKFILSVVKYPDWASILHSFQLYLCSSESDSSTGRTFRNANMTQYILYLKSFDDQTSAE